MRNEERPNKPHLGILAFNSNRSLAVGYINLWLNGVSYDARFVVKVRTNIFFFWRCGPTRAMTSFTRFLDHTQRYTTFGRISLDERSARRRDLYDNTEYSQETDIHAPGGIRIHNLSRWAAQTHTLGSPATGTGRANILLRTYWNEFLIESPRESVLIGFVLYLI